MNNSFESEIDKAFIQKRESVFNELTNEFLSRLENAADREFVKSNIVDEVNERKRRLYSSTLLVNEVNNIYKHDIILRFNEILKEQKTNPVERMILMEIPVLHKRHLENSSRTDFSYSFDRNFFDAESEQIVTLLSRYSGINHYIESLSFNKPNDATSIHELGILVDTPITTHSKRYIELLVPSYLKERTIKLMHDFLSDVGINISIEEFKKHFCSQHVEFKKIKWAPSERLIVYLFDQLQLTNIIPQGSYYSIVISHFTKRSGKSFSASQLAIALQQTNVNKLRNKEYVDDLISKLKNLT